MQLHLFLCAETLLLTPLTARGHRVAWWKMNSCHFREKKGLENTGLLSSLIDMQKMTPGFKTESWEKHGRTCRNEILTNIRSDTERMYKEGAHELANMKYGGVSIHTYSA